jgi:ADP-ribose pyrophosphatase YjhB (NUDIX family)
MVVCVGAVVLQGRRMLFVRQAQGQTLAGKWSIPWGIVDENEPPEAAAVRETLEESGVQVEIAGLLGIQNLPIPGWLGIIFLCRPTGGRPAPDGIETDQVAYFSSAELMSFEESIESWCKWLAQRVLTGTYTLTCQSPGNPYEPQKAFL